MLSNILKFAKSQTAESNNAYDGAEISELIDPFMLSLLTARFI